MTEEEKAAAQAVLKERAVQLKAQVEAEKAVGLRKPWHPRPARAAQRKEPEAPREEMARKVLDFRGMSRERKIELARLLQAAAGKAKSGAIDRYVPNPKQLEFHRSKSRYRLLLGGNRSGKTTAGAWEVAALALGEHRWRSETLRPPLNIWVAGVESKVVRRVLHRKLMQFIPNDRIESWREWEGSGILKLLNGSIVTFKSYKEDRENFQSEDLDFLWEDEEPPKEIHEEATVRLVDRMGHWIITMTPLRGMGWVYNDLYTRRQDTPNFEVVQASIFDNADNLGERAVKEFERRVGMSEDREARLYGGFTSLSGLFFPNWKEEINVREGADAACQPNWYTVCSLDPGGVDFTACVLLSRDFEGTWYVRREYLKRHGNIMSHAQAILKMLEGVKVDEYTGDSRARQWFEEYGRYGLPFWPCPAHEVAPVVERTKVLLNPRELVVRETGEKRQVPQLIVDASCKETIRQLREYRRYKNRWGEYEDKADPRQDDDAVDAIRYALFQDIMRPEKKIEPDVPWWMRAANEALSVDEHLGVNW